MKKKNKLNNKPKKATIGLNLQIPKDLHPLLKKQAKKKHISMHGLVLTAVEAYIVLAESAEMQGMITGV